MAPRDNQALLLQMSADIRTLQKSMDRANGVLDGGVKSMERRAFSGARTIEKAFGDIRLPNHLRREFNQLGQDIGNGLRTASTAAQIALAGVSVLAIKLATDAGEIEDAFNIAFKNSAKDAREFSNVLANEVGRDAVEVREAMTRLQLVLTGTGLNGDAAAELSKSLAKAAIDAGSLFNTKTDAEAFQKVISGITGESEPLKAFGVVINDAALKAELLRLGFKGSTQEASEQAKAIARANLILKGLAVAQDNAKNTASSAANQQRRLRAEFNQAARDLGQQLLPAYLKAIELTSGLLKGFNALPDGVQTASLAILAFIAASGPIAGLLANLGRVIKLAKETRAAIAAIATANAAAGASGAAGAVGGGLAAAGIAGTAVAGTAVAGTALAVQGFNFNRTVSNVKDATDAQLARALEIATASLASAQSGGPAGAAAAKRYANVVAKLTAEQARRGVEAAAQGQAPAVAGGAQNPTTVQGGFGLSPDQLKPVGGGAGGKGRKGAADRSAEQALRQQERADALLARASEDLAALQADRVQTAEEKYQAEREAVDRDRETRAGELAYAVKQKELTQAQADEVALKEEAVRIQRLITAGQKRDAEQAADRGALRQAELDGQEAALQLQASLARTAQARRDAELALLDLAEQRAQADLDVIAATKGTASIEYQIAQQRLNDLKAARPALDENVRRNTQGPLEDYFASLPQTADEVNEKFQQLEAQGISQLIDGLAAATVGAANLGDVFRQTIQQMAIDANRILLQSLLSSATGGGSGGLFSSLFKIGSSAFTKGFLSAGGFNGTGDISSLAGLYADGGPVRGPGSGRSDSVPAWLSNGEYVVNAAATARHRGLLDAINFGRAPRLARGGAIDNSRTWSPSVSIHVGGGGTPMERRETARQVEAGTMRALALARRQGY